MNESPTLGVHVITVGEAITSGQHVRKRGFDFAEGHPILNAGRVLDDRAIALAAASGHAALTVNKKPTVAILATGDELVEHAVPRLVALNLFGRDHLIEFDRQRAGQRAPYEISIGVRQNPQPIAVSLQLLQRLDAVAERGPRGQRGG